MSTSIMSLYAATYNLIRPPTADGGDDKISFTNTSGLHAISLIPDEEVADDIGTEGRSAETDPATADSLILNKATWGSAYINLTSTVIGAGVLGLPHAFASTGFIGGTLLLLVCACSSAFALHFLAKCAKRITPPVSFYAVSEVALPGYSSIIDFAVAVKCYGVATSYLVVIGDLMPAGESDCDY